MHVAIYIVLAAISAIVFLGATMGAVLVLAAVLRAVMGVFRG